MENIVTTVLAAKINAPYFARNYAETVPFHKNSRPENSVKLRYFYSVSFPGCQTLTQLILQNILKATINFTCYQGVGTAELTRLAFTRSKLTTETLEQGVNYGQS